MLSLKCTKVFVLIVLPFIGVIVSQSINKESKTVEEVEQIFEEIEEDHMKLKNVFKNVVFGEQETCKCVPFYLCKIEQGIVIKDGEGVLVPRCGDLSDPPPGEPTLSNEKWPNSPIIPTATLRLNTDEESQCKNPQDVCCMPNDIGLVSKMGPIQNEGKCGYGALTTPRTSDNNQPYAEYAEFPWTVMIANFQEGRGEYKCVGSLIHPQVVLTSAHCVEKTETIIVRAGEYNRRKMDEPKPYQNRLVSDTIKHPRFKIANLKFNVALLITDSPFNLDDNVNTACLTTALPDPATWTANECIATGWGMDKPEGRYSDIMRKMRFLLISSDRCQQTFRTTRLGELFELHHTFLCANNKYGSDTCEGNGGGPLMCPIAGQPGRYQQIGITSWGLGCADTTPSVFTNIPEIKDWVDEQFDELGFSREYYTYDNIKKRNF